jgi:hypothetical protein
MMVALAAPLRTHRRKIMVEHAKGAFASMISILQNGITILCMFCGMLIAGAFWVANQNSHLAAIDNNIASLSNTVAQMVVLSSRVQSLEDKAASRDDVLRSMQAQEGSMLSSLQNIISQLGSLNSTTQILVNQVLPGGQRPK